MFFFLFRLLHTRFIWLLLDVTHSGPSPTASVLDNDRRRAPVTETRMYIYSSFSLHRILVTTYLCFIYFIIYLSSLGQTYPQYFYRTRLRVSYYTTHIPVTYFLYYSHFIYVRSVLFRSNTVVLSSHPTEITFIYVTV